MSLCQCSNELEITKEAGCIPLPQPTTGGAAALSLGFKEPKAASTV